MASMFVKSVSVEQALISDEERDRWPFTVPCVAALARDSLELARPVTFLVGENASGKSTLVEAIAEASGLDARGGRVRRGSLRHARLLGRRPRRAQPWRGLLGDLRVDVHRARPVPDG